MKRYKLIKRKTNWVLLDEDDENVIIVAKTRKTCLDYMEQINQTEEIN